jgi:hypothetical protein
MSKYKSKPLSRDKLKTYPLKSRKSKIRLDSFSRIFSPDESFVGFIDSLPDILRGKDFKQFLHMMGEARIKKKARIVASGAHLIKVGLSPVIIDLMKQEWITALALNGAGIIHDFELAFAGHTSEDVESQLKDGRFGMARETGEILNQTINSARTEDIGLGEAVGRLIADSDFPYRDLSILGAAYQLRVPVTVHVALGTDVIHFHTFADGEALGKTSMRDFFLLCSLLEDLEGGGVFINIGSAVVLPEVFVKAVSFVRNRGVKLQDFSTAVFDFQHQYRPYQNVIKRPLGQKGRGFYFIGHHEIMIPLMAASLKAKSKKN